MTFDDEDNLFLLPGPVKIHPRVLRAMQRPALSHRSPEFKEVIEGLTRGLRYLFQTKGQTLVMTGSATLGMEAVIANVARPGEKLLVLENGRFGERFGELARRYAGPDAVVVHSDPGAPLDLERAEAVLRQGGVSAVAAVLNESSVGIENPGSVLADLAREHDALFLADGVTAVGGTDVPVDKWGIDACVVGSQKCVAAPPGLAMLSLSKEFLERAATKSLYMDLAAAAAKWNEGETPFTPATHLFVALQEAIELVAKETLEARLARTRRLARSLRAGLAGTGVPLLVPDAVASATVTAARFPAGVEDKDVREPLKREFGIVVAGGQGALKGRIFRVGHMGVVQPRELASFLACLEVVLGRVHHPVVPGAGVSAFDAAWAQPS